MVTNPPPPLRSGREVSISPLEHVAFQPYRFAPDCLALQPAANHETSLLRHGCAPVAMGTAAYDATEYVRWCQIAPDNDLPALIDEAKARISQIYR